MEHEEHFYSELKNIPVVPEEIYPEIEKKIGQHKRNIRSIWLMAACLALIIGGTFYFQQSTNRNNTIAWEAEAGLQYVEDYFSYNDLQPDSIQDIDNEIETEDEFSAIIDFFSGKNIEQDVSMYAILENEFL